MGDGDGDTPLDQLKPQVDYDNECGYYPEERPRTAGSENGQKKGKGKKDDKKGLDDSGKKKKGNPDGDIKELAQGMYGLHKKFRLGL